MAQEGSHTKQYLTIFICLVVLTGLTVGVSYVDLGSKVNLAIGLMIAATKATLVALFFMHLKHDGGLDGYFYIAALFPLVLFFIVLTPPILDIAWLPHWGIPDTLFEALTVK